MFEKYDKVNISLFQICFICIEKWRICILSLFKISLIRIEKFKTFIIVHVLKLAHLSIFIPPKINLIFPILWWNNGSVPDLLRIFVPAESFCRFASSLSLVNFPYKSFWNDSGIWVGQTSWVQDDLAFKNRTIFYKEPPNTIRFIIVVNLSFVYQTTLGSIEVNLLDLIQVINTSSQDKEAFID